MWGPESCAEPDLERVEELGAEGQRAWGKERGDRDKEPES